MKRRQMAAGSARGFTLIELLIVLVIVGILVGLLFPIFSRAREGGRMAACASNLQQIGVAMQLYVRDNNGGFAPVVPIETRCLATAPANPVCPQCRDFPLFWGRLLVPYTRNEDIFRCPSVGIHPISGSGGDMTWDSCPPPPGGGGGGGGGIPCPIIEPPKATMESDYVYNAMVPHPTAWAHSPGANPNNFGFDRSPAQVTCRVVRRAALPIREARLEQPATTFMIVDAASDSTGDGAAPTGDGHLITDLQLDYFVPPPTDKRFQQPKTIVAKRHNDGFNALFADGHVKHIVYGTSKPANWTVQAD